MGTKGGRRLTSESVLSGFCLLIFLLSLHAPASSGCVCVRIHYFCHLSELTLFERKLHYVRTNVMRTMSFNFSFNLACSSQFCLRLRRDTFLGLRSNKKSLPK